MMSNQPTMDSVIDVLAAEGYIEDIEQITLPERKNDTWYIQGMLGCGGWIAAAFFFLTSGFFVAMLVADLGTLAFGYTGIVFGIALMIGSTIGNNNEANNVFIDQMMLAGQIAGQSLLYVGIGILVYEYMTDDWKPNATIIALSMIGINVMMIGIYRDGIFRFLATLTIIAALNGLMYLWNLPAGLSFVIVAMALANLVIWGDMLPIHTQIERYTLLQNVGYGITIGMGFTIIYQIANGYREFGAASSNLNTPIITSLLLLGLVILLVVRLLNEYGVDLKSPTAIGLIAMTTIITLPTLITPGILAGIFVLLLGYRKHNWILIGLAVAFLVGFVSEYYYSLEFTLLVKSIILMTTGVLFLIGRMILQRYLPTPPTQEVSA